MLLTSVVLGYNATTCKITTVHLVQFQVVNRQTIGGAVRPPELWETGFKDTVIAYPNEITRVQARFDYAGRFVWHCHILEHEDNEMMRPYIVLAAPNGDYPPVICYPAPASCTSRPSGLLHQLKSRLLHHRKCR